MQWLIALKASIYIVYDINVAHEWLIRTKSGISNWHKPCFGTIVPTNNRSNNDNNDDEYLTDDDDNTWYIILTYEAFNMSII